MNFLPDPQGHGAFRDTFRLPAGLFASETSADFWAMPSSSSNQTNSLGSSDVASGASPSVTEIGEAMAQLRQLQRKIKAEYRDVGTEFAAEARKIHYGESAPENIYGQSSEEEREALLDEGIDVVAMPWVPPEH